jgi:hypothetical protein
VVALNHSLKNDALLGQRFFLEQLNKVNEGFWN